MLGKTGWCSWDAKIRWCMVGTRDEWLAWRQQHSWNGTCIHYYTWYQCRNGTLGNKKFHIQDRSWYITENSNKLPPAPPLEGVHRIFSVMEVLMPTGSATLVESNTFAGLCSVKPSAQNGEVMTKSRSTQPPSLKKKKKTTTFRLFYVNNYCTPKYLKCCCSIIRPLSIQKQ